MPRGIRGVSDAKILEEFRSGKFISQIRRDHHVGIARIRRILDSENLREAVA